MLVYLAHELCALNISAKKNFSAFFLDLFALLCRLHTFPPCCSAVPNQSFPSFRINTFPSNFSSLLHVSSFFLHLFALLCRINTWKCEILFFLYLWGIVSFSEKYVDAWCIHCFYWNLLQVHAARACLPGFTREQPAAPAHSFTSERNFTYTAISQIDVLLCIYNRVQTKGRMFTLLTVHWLAKAERLVQQLEHGLTTSGSSEMCSARWKSWHASE